MVFLRPQPQAAVDKRLIWTTTENVIKRRKYFRGENCSSNDVLSIKFEKQTRLFQHVHKIIFFRRLQNLCRRFIGST